VRGRCPGPANERGASLALDKGSPRLGRGIIAHTALFEVERFEDEPPPVTAFEPPAFVGRSDRSGRTRRTWRIEPFTLKRMASPTGLEPVFPP